MTTKQSLTEAETAALAAYTALRTNTPTRELAVASRDAVQALADLIGIDYGTAYEVVAGRYRWANR